MHVPILALLLIALAIVSLMIGSDPKSWYGRIAFVLVLCAVVISTAGRLGELYADASTAIEAD